MMEYLEDQILSDDDIAWPLTSSITDMTSLGLACVADINDNAAVMASVTDVALHQEASLGPVTGGAEAPTLTPLSPAVGGHHDQGTRVFTTPSPMSFFHVAPVTPEMSTSQVLPDGYWNALAYLRDDDVGGVPSDRGLYSPTPPTSAFSTPGSGPKPVEAGHDPRRDTSPGRKVTEISPLPDFAQLQPAAVKPKTSVSCTRNIDDDDLDLATAALKAEATGDKTPLVRNELKWKIQTKRRLHGLDDLKVEWKEPAASELTPRDIVRRQRRQESNRRAARKCREKKRQASEGVLKNLGDLTQQNEQLRQEVAQLRLNDKQLREAINQHRRKCPLGGADLPVLEVMG